MRKVISGQASVTLVAPFQYFLIFLPVLICFNIINTYAVNIPCMDDYDAVLKFLSNYKTAGAYEKLCLLFSQHYEHRILFSRLTYVIYYSLFGDINFRTLIFIGNLEMLAAFFMMLSLLKKALPHQWPYAAIALSMCMFDLNNYENSGLAMTAIANYGTIVLFITSIFLYNKQGNRYLVAALLIQLLVTYSNGNGPIASFIIMLFTIAMRRKKEMIAATICFIVFAPLYMIHFHKGITTLYAKSIAQIIPYFLHLVGAHFSNDYGVIAGIIILVILLVSFPSIKSLKSYKEALPLIAILIFVMATMVTISLFRKDVETEKLSHYTSRYFIYSHLTVAIAFSFLLHKIKDKNAMAIIATSGLTLLLFTYKMNYTSGKAGFVQYNYFLENADYFYTDRLAGRLMAERACKLGIYCINDERLNPTIISPAEKH